MSLEPNVADLRYFKLWILLDQIIWVWNIKGLRHWVPKILGLENQSLLQRVNSFGLSVCLFVSNKRQNGWTDQAQIFCGTSSEHREGLWMIKIKKCVLKVFNFVKKN